MKDSSSSDCPVTQPIEGSSEMELEEPTSANDPSSPRIHCLTDPGEPFGSTKLPTPINIPPEEEGPSEQNTTFTAANNSPDPHRHPCPATQLPQRGEHSNLGASARYPQQRHVVGSKTPGVATSSSPLLAGWLNREMSSSDNPRSEWVLG